MDFRKHAAYDSLGLKHTRGTPTPSGRNQENIGHTAEGDHRNHFAHQELEPTVGGSALGAAWLVLTLRLWLDVLSKCCELSARYIHSLLKHGDIASLISLQLDRELPQRLYGDVES